MINHLNFKCSLNSPGNYHSTHTSYLYPLAVSIKFYFHRSFTCLSETPMRIQSQEDFNITMITRNTMSIKGNDYQLKLTIPSDSLHLFASFLFKLGRLIRAFLLSRLLSSYYAISAITLILILSPLWLRIYVESAIIVIYCRSLYEADEYIIFYMEYSAHLFLKHFPRYFLITPDLRTVDCRSEEL